ncbi:MAG TPA: alpha/beta fold hydrolase [Flavobacterium sp.]|nr:alpha/beta fold hydrolase [Flavobacterium sp.]
MKSIGQILLYLISLFAVIYLLAISYIYFNQEQMIFKPKYLSQDYKFNFNQNFEELKLASFDGSNLNGLLFKSEQPKGLIFYLHGNAGALDTWGNIAEVYTELGYDIFILDYRGFGKSEGKIESEEQFHEDISKAYDVMKKKYNEDKIIIIGYSIGSGPAVKLALDSSPKMLILQTPYYNFNELASSRFPFVPNFLKKYNFETDKIISRVKVPIFIFHGEKDNLITPDNSQKLFNLIKKDKHLYILKNQEHIGMNENQEYKRELNKILN